MNIIDCDTREDSQRLISVADCIAFLTSQAIPSTLTEYVGPKDACGRILADEATSTINVPNFDNSAMDGYALHVTKNLKPPYSFKLTGRIAAGEVGKPLEKNCASKIFTGAKLPSGTNCVAILERSEERDGQVEIFGLLKIGENIRLKGDDIKAGETILAQGKKLTPSDIGLCVSVGISQIKVIKPLTIGVFFSGNELLEPNETLTDGKIYNSNRYTINILLQNMGVNIIDIGNIQDDFAITKAALDKLSNKCDVIITTGGVSVGEEDHIKPAVEALGSIDMWSIKMKPGKPLAYGRVRNTHFIGLPGNPVSAMATFHLFVQPFLEKLSGNTKYHHQTLKVQLGFDVSNRLRREFVRVRLDNSTIPPTAIAYKNQSSGVLSSMSWADGLLEIPDESNVKKGDILNYYPL